MIVRQTVHAKTRRGNKRPEGEILFYNLRGCKLNMTHDHEATWDTDITLMITFQKTKKDRQFRVGKRPEGEIRCKLNITHDHEANRELNIRITKRRTAISLLCSSRVRRSFPRNLRYEGPSENF